MVVQTYHVLDDDDKNSPLAKLTEFELSTRSGATGGTPCQLRQGRDRRPQARSCRPSPRMSCSASAHSRLNSLNLVRRD